MADPARDLRTLSGRRPTLAGNGRGGDCLSSARSARRYRPNGQHHVIYFRYDSFVVVATGFAQMYAVREEYLFGIDWVARLYEPGIHWLIIGAVLGGPAGCPAAEGEPRAWVRYHFSRDTNPTTDHCGIPCAYCRTSSCSLYLLARAPQRGLFAIA